MNKFNFNSIDNLEIPDSWADKAIEIAKTPKVVPIAKRMKFLAFAASLVLVCGISVAMFFIANENAIPKVLKSHPTEVTFYNETSTNQSTDETDKKQTGTENPTDSNLDNTQTIEPAEKVTTSPTQNKKPSVDSTKPHSTQKPTVPQQTDSDDTSDFVPTEKTTESIIVPTVPQDEPTTPVIILPSKPPREDVDPKDIYVNVTVYKHLVLDDKKIYCKVYDENGVLLGDPDAFSDEHLTELTFYSYYTAYYYPYRYSLISKSGDYTFVFYNSNGEVAREVTKYLEYFEP